MTLDDEGGSTSLDWDRSEASWLADARISIAGIVAEEMYLEAAFGSEFVRELDLLGSKDGDIADYCKALEKMGCSSDAAQRALRQSVEDDIRTNWHRMKALAEALLAKGSLTGAEVVQLIEATE